MKKPIALDITAIAEMNFTTGVQRVVRQFIAANANKIEFIRYDDGSNTWRSVPELGQIVVREQSGVLAGARAAAEKASNSIVEKARKTPTRSMLREIPFARPLYFGLKKMISRHLQTQAVERTYSLREQPEWHPSPDQTYLMMDIPVQPWHTWAMQDIFSKKVMRSVVYVHDLFPLTHHDLFERESVAGVRSLHLEYLDAVGMATEVITNSEFTLGQYESYCRVLEHPPVQKKSVVYLPWPHLVSKGPRDESLARRIFGEAKVRVLLIGQLDKRKNFRVVVAAFKDLIAKGVDARLGVLAGYSTMSDSALELELETCTPEQRERIAIQGIVTDAELLAMYDAVDVVAVPSTAEGYGLPVVEALSRGKRVIAANATALPELAAKFEKGAVTIVDPYDPKAWAKAIREVTALPPLGKLKLSKDFPADWREFGERLLRNSNKK